MKNKTFGIIIFRRGACQQGGGGPRVLDPDGVRQGDEEGLLGQRAILATHQADNRSPGTKLQSQSPALVKNFGFNGSLSFFQLNFQLTEMKLQKKSNHKSWNPEGLSTNDVILSFPFCHTFVPSDSVDMASQNHFPRLRF